jgi:two-component system, sensor histidine kinase PdtaS
MHKLLQRQISRAFGGAEPDSPRLRELLLAVDAAYIAADDDRLMLERSLDLTSQIMLKKNEELRAARDAAETAKERAEKADHEKGVLLREVHHRVKNNLQVIVSLLSLQAAAKGHEGYRAFIGEATGCIMSMATIHEMLYESGDFSSLDFSAYAKKIARNAARSSGAKSSLDLDLRLAPIALALEQAMPCGLIINEALTNSLKHGRAEDGRVRITMRLAWEGKRIVVDVADAGPGFPPDFAEARGGGLGRTLMASLAEQIQGEIHFENRGGAHVRLVFTPAAPEHEQAQG